MYWYCISSFLQMYFMLINIIFKSRFSVKSFWSTPLYIFLELERIKNPWHHLPSRELLIRSAQHVWEAVHLSKPRVSDPLRFTFWEQSGPETFDLNEHHMNWFHVYFTGISCLHFIWVTLRRHKCIFLFKFSLHVPSDQWFNNLIFWIVYYVSFRIIAVLIFTCTCV